MRVKAFELQAKQGEEWKTVHSGKGIGRQLEVKFEPVTARLVRLKITEGQGGPTIHEFQVFARLGTRVRRDGVDGCLV